MILIGQESCENDMVLDYNTTEVKPIFNCGNETVLAYFDRCLRCIDSNCLLENLTIVFTINKEGVVVNPVVLPKEKDCLGYKEYKESISSVIMNMPKWQPGMSRGDKVCVRYVLKIGYPPAQPKP